MSENLFEKTGQYAIPLHEQVVPPIDDDERLFSISRGGENKDLREWVPLVQGRGIPDKYILN